jgi:hypothetical protein
MRLQDIEAIVRALNDAEARYLIVGGLAVVAHGYPRLTVDLDIVLNLKRENVLRAMNALEQIGYRPIVPVPGAQFADEEMRRAWREEKHMIVFQMYNPDPRSTRLDLFVTEPFDFDKEYAQAEWLHVAFAGFADRNAPGDETGGRASEGFGRRWRIKKIVGY